MPAPSFPDDTSDSATAGPVHVVVLSGEVDFARMDELDDIVDAFRSGTDRHVDVDLTQVEFLDSTGLGTIFRLRRIAEARGGRIRLLRPSRKVRRALELAGTTDLIDAGER